MSGAARPLSLGCKWTSWVNVGYETGRVNLVWSWNEYNIYTKLLEQVQITWQVTWIAFQVLVRAKLSGVNKYAGSKYLVLFSCLAYERKMSLVKISHR